MKLVLSNGTTLDDVVASEKRLEVRFTSYSEVASIYASINNDTINGSHWETSTGVTMGSYNNIEIASSTVAKNSVVYTLIDARTAEITALEAKVDEQASTITELSDMVDMLLVTTLEPSDEEIIVELENEESEVVEDVQQA